MEIRPQDLPELRADLLEYYRRPSALETWRTMADEGMFIIPGDGQTFLAEEIRRLRRETYWVSPDMAALAEVAGPTMPEFTLNEHDLPSLYGFMYFASPIGTVSSPRPDGVMVTVPVVACSWGKVTATDGTALWLSLYTTSRSVEEMQDAFGLTAEHASQVRAMLPSLAYENETLIPFGEEWSTFVRESSFLNTVGRSIRAAWSLMQQPLAELSEVEPDRAARKRLRRAGHEPAAVRVIELRRPKHNGEPGETGRDYHHQWVVRGHWRNHWHPKRQVHRPVWIAPHVKGPEGAPMIGGEKVYAWKR